MTASREPGKIITFYSYKGGTGRSMALANIAWVLASSGKRVLAVDWDLEAPGLHRYFYPFLIDKNLNSTDGVIDLVHNYAVAAMSPLPGTEVTEPWFLPQANILHYTASLDWNRFKKGGRLDFISAGRQGPSYATRMNTFSWQNFYERLGGAAFLDAVKESMRDEYDYILIDSRTGVSDTSGICTVKMPDILVICFTLNNQSIDGAAAVASSVFSARPDSGLRIFPVPMRIDPGEQKKLEMRTEYARGKFSGFPNYITNGSGEDYWDNIPILYTTYYAYEEILAAFGPRVGKVASLMMSLELLTSYLTDNKVTRLELPPDETVDDVLKRYEGRPARVDPLDRLDAAADAAIAGLAPEQKVIARRVLLRLVRVPRPEEVGGKTRQRVDSSEFDLSSRSVIQTLRDAQLLTIETDDQTGLEMVQIAQDALIEKWKQLQSWIEEDRQFLVWRQEIQSSVIRYRRAVEKAVTVRIDSLDEGMSSLLLRGPDLDEAKYWLRKHISDLTQREIEFIQASLSRREAERERERSAHPAEAQDLKQPGIRRRSTLKPRVDSENVSKAKDILRGLTVSPEEMFKLAQRLKGERSFGYARMLLSRISRSQISDLSLWTRIRQGYALCTYKDADLAADMRLDRALQILRELEDISITADQETLGLVGAIYKRKWEVDGQKQNLELSLAYYDRGCKIGVASDFGYTGINAAFVQDLLSNQEETEARSAGTNSESALTRRKEAGRIREEIVATLPALAREPGKEWLQHEWWFLVTVAEAYFGLRRYTDALPWLKKAAELENISEWERHSTVGQLANLARLHDESAGATQELEYTEAWEVLNLFLGDNVAAVRTAFIGKVGLALSGGGFRASLFHIGVLAKLAELDALRHIEVLSCVSGGSIIGAHYYLEVRKLLESKPDDEITREDYVQIVKRIEQDFLAGVQRNIRTRVAAEFTTNLKMIFKPNYSRTVRVGELYEREIFSRVSDGEGGEPRYLSDLRTQPIDYPEEFNPKYDNWRRAAKVPILILNATTLNTGHNWQFTTSWMGEPPAGISGEIDANDRLRRMYYEEAPEGYRHFQLGKAVAASSCVPGVFEPVALDSLYPERVVRLVDGGVQDNQGAAGLLDQDCKVVLVSDASGQKGSVHAPGSGILNVLLRSGTISQARLREAQFNELAARRRSSLLRGLMFLHLKKDLDADPVNWLGSNDPFDASDEARPVERRGVLTTYGIRKDIQQYLAAMRTDLDSFSQVEAYALMNSGYRMADRALADSIKDFPKTPTYQPDWGFLALQDSLRGGTGYNELVKRLRVSHLKGFKIWRLSVALRIMSMVIGVGVVYGLYQLCLRWWDQPSGLITLGITLTVTFTMIIASVLIRLVGPRLQRVMNWNKTPSEIAIGCLSLLALPVTLLHLFVFDRLFLRDGRIRRVLGYERSSVGESQAASSKESNSVDASANQL